MINGKRIVQVLLVVVIVGSAIRETRILRDINGLEWTDLNYWGIYIDEESYTIQNLVCVLGSLVSLGLLSRLRSPKVRSESLESKEHTTPKEPSSRKGRESNPFEEINPKWRVVLGNPRASTTHRKKERVPILDCEKNPKKMELVCLTCEDYERCYGGSIDV